MAYDDHFKLADDLVAHLDTVIGVLNDPFIESRYTGFVTVSAVTVLELALKTIFLEFAQAKHIVLGTFCSRYFDRINGRIGLSAIRDDYLVKFGQKYQTRFAVRIEKIEQHSLRRFGTSVRSSYGNLITWRNTFAHEGIIPANANYSEAKRAYECGKQVMQCLAGCMNR